MSRGIAGEYENRSEYHHDANEQRALKEQALESIEDLLLTERATETTGLWCTFENDTITRHMRLAHTDAPVEDEDVFVGDDGTIEVRQVQRRAVSVDIIVQSEQYRRGSLRESTEVTVRESVYGFKALLMTRYTIEQYLGGDMKAYIDHPDLTSPSGHELREMLPYDYQLFERQMNVIVALRKGILAGNRGAESELSS